MERKLIDFEAVHENMVGKTITEVSYGDDGEVIMRLEGRECPTIDLHIEEVRGCLYLHVHDDDPKAPQVLPGQLSMVSDSHNHDAEGVYAGCPACETLAPKLSPRISSSFCICGHREDEHSNVYGWCNTPGCQCGVMHTSRCVCGHMKMVHDKNGACIGMESAVLCDCTCYVYNNQGIE